MEQQLKAAVSNVQTLATDKYKRAVAAVDGYVSNSPWRAVGIAVAIGALIGFFTAKR
jgi:ElaB/YqjD/DUF883 family membrane-anchored ribosome-binding protein